jgi:hypothetical protein
MTFDEWVKAFSTSDEWEKSAIRAKQYHCKQCRKTGIRFDAKLLGFSVSETEGTREYTGSCIGCYWNDPNAFNHEVSKDFRMEAL